MKARDSENYLHIPHHIPCINAECKKAIQCSGDNIAAARRRDLHGASNMKHKTVLFGFSKDVVFTLAVLAYIFAAHQR